jgi:hypothetical protein
MAFSGVCISCAQATPAIASHIKTTVGRRIRDIKRLPSLVVQPRPVVAVARECIV